MNSFIIFFSFIIKFIFSFPKLSFDFKCPYLYSQIYFFRGINKYLVVQSRRLTILYDIHENYNVSLSFFDRINQAKGTFNPTMLFINDIICLTLMNKSFMQLKQLSLLYQTGIELHPLIQAQ